MALIRLGARRTRAGVSAKGGRHIEGAFIAQARRGKRQVFRRKGRARLPIAVQTARIEAQTTDYLENDLSGSRDFEQQFRQVFEHELIIGFRQGVLNPGLEIRKLAAALVAWVHMQRWGLQVGAADVLGCWPDDFDPGLEQYEC